MSSIVMPRAYRARSCWISMTSAMGGCFMVGPPPSAGQPAPTRSSAPRDTSASSPGDLGAGHGLEIWHIRYYTPEGDATRSALTPKGAGRAEHERHDTRWRTMFSFGEGCREMRIGLMVGPERGRYATKVERLRADAQWAEGAGLATVWIPQIPDDFDGLPAAAIIGDSTTRLEIGTAVVPVQPRPPIALAQQTLSVQAVCQGRLSL